MCNLSVYWYWKGEEHLFSCKKLVQYALWIIIIPFIFSLSTGLYRRKNAISKFLLSPRSKCPIFQTIILNLEKITHLSLFKDYWRYKTYGQHLEVTEPSWIGEIEWRLELLDFTVGNLPVSYGILGETSLSWLNCKGRL